MHHNSILWFHRKDRTNRSFLRMEILRDDLLHLICGNGALACLISGDQLHRWEDSVIAVGFQLVAGSITIRRIIHHTEMLPVEDFIRNRMQNRKIRISREFF